MPLKTKGLRGWLLSTVTHVGRSMGEGLDTVRIHCEVVEVWNLNANQNVK